MTKQKKIIIFSALLIFVVLLVGVGSLIVKQPSAKPAKIIEPIDLIDRTANKINVKLVINTGSNKYEYNESVGASSTVFDLLNKVSLEKKFSFIYEDSSLGVFVDEIYGVKNDPAANMYWMYKVNNQLANVGASNKKINEGDLVDWYYGEVSGY